jgi:UDP-N-acetylglucosamine--N-acetylmuramyl-(pentapeptide) pyrophosphoryl-undecaprenol N-acetylglucosamine transferase
VTNYLLAGGGTAGHVNPLLALADKISDQPGVNSVFALGTKEGLESRLVPQRGYRLLTIARLPFPRRPNRYAMTFLFNFNQAVNQVKAMIVEHKIDVVVGFGGYASAPAYRAALALGIPYVVHEANALPGYANRVGAKRASAVAVAFRNTKLPRAKFVGMPLRQEIANLAKDDLRIEALEYFGLDRHLTTLLVTGGSLGAKRINETIEQSRELLFAAGIQVIHIVGERAGLEDLKSPGYVRLSYCDRMDFAIAAADIALSRAGAATVSEFCAVGLPAIYVPYAVGNGEQAFNLVEVVNAGGAIEVKDDLFDLDYVRTHLIPLASNKRQIEKMARLALSVGSHTGSAELLTLVNGVLPVR